MALHDYRPVRHGHITAAPDMAPLFPALFSGGLPCKRVYIGDELQNNAALNLDPWELYELGLITSPNIIVVGVMGSGKTAFATNFAFREYPFPRKIWIRSPSRVDYVRMGKLVDASIVALYPNGPSQLNPFDPIIARESQILIASSMISFAKAPVDATTMNMVSLAMDRALQAARDQGEDQMVLGHLISALVSPSDEDAKALGRDIRRLREDASKAVDALSAYTNRGHMRGMFDSRTKNIDTGNRMVILDLSETDRAIKPIAMSISSSWMNYASDLEFRQTGVKQLSIRDEGFEEFKDLTLMRAMQADYKYTRKEGRCQMLLLQHLFDAETGGDEGTEQVKLARGLVRDSEIVVIMRQTEEQIPYLKATFDLSDEECRRIPNLQQGEMLIKVGKLPSFDVQHIMSELEAGLTFTDKNMEDVAQTM